MFVYEAIQEFLLDQQSRGSKPTTLKWYRTTLNRLLEKELQEPLVKLNVFTINRVLSLQVKPATLANYDRALRTFCNWLHGIGALNPNPFAKRKRPRDPWQPREVLTADEIEKLLSYVKKATRSKHRNLAMLALMLDCGLRAIEVSRLEIQNINWELGEIRIDGKTGYSVIPLSKKAYTYLKRYVSQGRKTTTSKVFARGGKGITSHSITCWVRATAKKAGIKKRVGSHLLRHTFATHYLRSGGDAFSLQRILRHTSPLMTQRYLHFVIGDLQDKLQTHSPLSNVL